MADMIPVSDRIDPTQAKELLGVVELEARWENLRCVGQANQEPATLQCLHGKQKAYEAFRAKLAAYNKRFSPPHIPEVLLNTTLRLGAWCRAVRKLYQHSDAASPGQAAAQVLEKAYRWSDIVAGKESKSRISRSGPPATVAAAVAELEALSQWCADAAKIAPAA